MEMVNILAKHNNDLLMVKVHTGQDGAVEEIINSNFSKLGTELRDEITRQISDMTSKFKKKEGKRAGYYTDLLEVQSEKYEKLLDAQKVLHQKQLDDQHKKHMKELDDRDAQHRIALAAQAEQDRIQMEDMVADQLSELGLGPRKSRRVGSPVRVCSSDECGNLRGANGVARADWGLAWRVAILNHFDNLATFHHGTLDLVST